MATNCSIFGDLVPNIYIDRVFLEESLKKSKWSSGKTYEEGAEYLQTPILQ